MSDGLVLLCDGDPRSSTAIGLALAHAGRLVRTVQDPDELLGILDRNQADLVIVGISQPSGKSFDLCRRIRERSDIPLLAVTDPMAELDRVVALEMGADTCVSRPINEYELTLRLDALGGRWSVRDGIRPPRLIPIGDASVDPDGRRILRAGREVKVKPRVFDLLDYFLAHEGEILTREHLLRHVWKSGDAGANRTVVVHVSWLRQALGVDSSGASMIETIRGVGYRFRRPEA